MPRWSPARGPKNSLCRASWEDLGRERQGMEELLQSIFANPLPTIIIKKNPPPTSPPSTPLPPTKITHTCVRECVHACARVLVSGVDFLAGAAPRPRAILAPRRSMPRTRFCLPRTHVGILEEIIPSMSRAHRWQTDGSRTKTLKRCASSAECIARKNKKINK